MNTKTKVNFMKRKLFLSMVMALMITSLNLSGQVSDTSYWKKGVEFGVGLNQIALSNWAAGGNSSFAGNAFLNLNANYSKGKHSWINSLRLAYGLSKAEGEITKKTDDKIELTSKYGYQIHNSWFFSALGEFKTQFTDGFDYKVNDSVPISKFLAPAYLTLGLGLDYMPNSNFSLFMSPASIRLTVVNDQRLADLGSFGVKKAEYDELGNLVKHGEKSLFGFGGTIKMVYKTILMENIAMESRLTLFSDYLNDPQNIDVNFETQLIFKVNKYISANISANLVYDDNVTITDKDGKSGPRTQFKEVLGLGLSYKLEIEYSR